MNYSDEYILGIAKVCHQAHKAFCEMHNDDSQQDWDNAEEWQRKSSIDMVAFCLNNPQAGNDALHNSWMEEKIQTGWVYGEIKNSTIKTHPCILPFEQLPIFQQQKDTLFISIVKALK